MSEIISRIFEAFQKRGNDKYGDEVVTQLQHAIQCADLAKDANQSPQLIVAALLHDLGHILPDSDLPENCQTNLDDKHEEVGHQFLMQYFGPSIADPVRMHVAAKRYLCTKDAKYEQILSPTSLKSYYDQGGPMSPEEMADFESEPHFEQALKLRGWDDTAKSADIPMSELEDFRGLLQDCLLNQS